MIDDAHYAPVLDERIIALIAEWRAQWPAMGLLLLLPEAERERVPWLQSVCRAQGVPQVGALFPALVADDGFATRGGWLLRFDRMPGYFLLDAMDAEPAVAAARLAQAWSDLPDTRPAPEAPGAAAAASPGTLFLICDGMIPTIGSLLAELFTRIKHRVRYVGVNAGSERFEPMPCVFDAQRCIGQGVLGLYDTRGTGAVVAHGYPVSRALMKATSTTGNRIDRIDGRPAFEAYQSVIASEYGVALTHGNFYEHAVHFPFGVVTALDVLVRIPVGFGEDGAIVCVGEIPPGSMLKLLHAPALEDSRCVDTIVTRLTQVKAAATAPLLAFYCAGRRMHFGAQADAELAQLRQRAGVLGRFAGALSLGEIDSTDADDMGIPRFHNAAMVCLKGTETS